MVKSIHAICEGGILGPLERLDLKASQRLKLTLEVLPSVVEQTQALIRAKANIVHFTARHAAAVGANPPVPPFVKGGRRGISPGDGLSEQHWG